MLTKPIPATGESLPVIGLGTYSVFDVDSTAEAIANSHEIVERLTSAGGSLLDTSPMYNRSEKVIGDVIAAGIERQDVFLATKVLADGSEAGRSITSATPQCTCRLFVNGRIKGASVTAD